MGVDVRIGAGRISSLGPDRNGLDERGRSRMGGVKVE
jgi:hypothetical protein